MNSKTLFILNFVLLASFTYTSAQSECTNPIDKPDKKVEFKAGERALFQFMDTAMFPIILNCIKNDRTNITSLHIRLTVDCKGDVTDAIFQEQNPSQNCKNEMRNKLLTLKGWSPATKNGKAVCAYYEIPIGNLSIETD